MKKFLTILFLLSAVIFDLYAANNWYVKKFPPSLVNAKGKRISTAKALHGKTVAVYFSASWCGPCKGFTPKLVKFYKKNAKKHNIEVVFVSSDKNSQAMMDYMQEDSMPWAAVPFNSSKRLQIKKEHRVNGIPTLIVFDANGKLISPDARWDVTLLGNKAVKAWKSPKYKPKTYQDYTAEQNKNKKSSRRSKSNRRKNRK